MADQTVVNGTAVQEIAALTRLGQPVRYLDVDGVRMTPEQLHDARPKLPAPAPLIVHTLTGLVDYVAANRDQLELSQHLVHVVDPEQVELVSRLEGTFKQRFGLVTAQVPERIGFVFGRYLDLEQMNISLQALFTPFYDRDSVLQIVGNVTTAAEVQLEDDGITQNATVRAGMVVHLGNTQARIPNPVELAPYRTFLEVEQPASRCVLRVKADGEKVGCALYEADGGMWKLEAIKRIADWLKGRIPEQLEVVA